VSAATEVKRREIEGLVREANGLLDQHKGRGLSGEVKTQLVAMQETIAAKRGEIEAAEAEDSLRDGFKTADTWLNQPIRSLPHGVNGDDDDKKALERQGWEFKSGLAYAPTSSGKTVRDVRRGRHPRADQLGRRRVRGVPEDDQGRDELRVQGRLLQVLARCWPAPAAPRRWRSRR
jgi:hypothetical protein